MMLRAVCWTAPAKSTCSGVRLGSGQMLDARRLREGSPSEGSIGPPDAPSRSPACQWHCAGWLPDPVSAGCACAKRAPTCRPGPPGHSPGVVHHVQNIACCLLHEAPGQRSYSASTFASLHSHMQMSHCIHHLCPSLCMVQGGESLSLVLSKHAHQPYICATSSSCRSCHIWHFQPWSHRPSSGHRHRLIAFINMCTGHHCCYCCCCCCRWQQPCKHADLICSCVCVGRGHVSVHTCSCCGSWSGLVILQNTQMILQKTWKQRYTASWKS